MKVDPIKAAQDLAKWEDSLEGRWLCRWKKYLERDPSNLVGWSCPIRQAEIFPDRKWAWDFAWRIPGEWVAAVEVHGASGRTKTGGRTIGRHQRPEGMAEDFQKNNSATARGISVFYFNTIIIHDQKLFNEQAALLLQTLRSRE